MLRELGRQSHPFCSGEQGAAGVQAVEGQGGDQTKGRVKGSPGRGNSQNKSSEARKGLACLGSVVPCMTQAEGGGGSVA